MIFVVIFLSIYLGYALAHITGTPAEPLAWAIARTHGVASLYALLDLAALLAVIAFTIRLWGSSYLNAAVVWSANARDERLIEAGPFRFVRNPLYFGNLIVGLSVAIMTPPIGVPILLLAMYVFHSALAAHESTLLQARYGDEYSRYAATVPALIPRLTPARANLEPAPHPSLRQGLRAEVLMLYYSIGTIAVAFAPTTNVFRLFWILFPVAYVVQRILARAR